MVNVISNWKYCVVKYKKNKMGKWGLPQGEFSRQHPLERQRSPFGTWDTNWCLHWSFSFCCGMTLYWNTALEYSRIHRYHRCPVKGMQVPCKLLFLICWDITLPITSSEFTLCSFIKTNEKLNIEQMYVR